MEAGLFELLRFSSDRSTEPRAYEEALITWATRYNLIKKWCRTWLKQTLFASRLLFLSNPRAELEIDLGYEFHGPPSVEPLPLPDLAWNPFEVGRHVVEHRYQKYLDLVERTYCRAGFRFVPERRKPLISGGSQDIKSAAGRKKQLLKRYLWTALQ